MTISDEYFALLDHLGHTRPVRDLLGNEPDMVVLRHDVDHDLDLALEMAFWEQRHGHRATYFLLPSAPYWQDELLDEKILQLADYGHEVGLHLNGLAEWADGRVDDIEGRLRSSLSRLRAGGLEVIGSAAHGDRACYTHGVINNWVFAELEPDDPEHEDGLSAEGVPSPDPSFRIPYRSDVVTRTDGATFPLWSVSMDDLGLAYEAVRLPMDGYYSDSGGSWTRSPDPRTVDLSNGRHQVLVHPEYYRGPQRFVFVMSTARSGSKWVAAALARASSAESSHEHTLNHVLDDAGAEVRDHRTGPGFTSLLADREEVRRRIAQVRALREASERDHVECNVYLPHCLPELRSVYPFAHLVHLHREPGLVLRSLLNREWYDTPFDDRHAAIDVPGWDDLSQVERCGAYITAVTIDLWAARDDDLGLDDAVHDENAMIDTFARAGIAVHGRLLAPLWDEVVDPSTASFVDPIETWPSEQQARALTSIAHAVRLLGSRSSQPTPRTPADTIDDTLVDGLDDRAAVVGGRVQRDGPMSRFVTDGDRHAYLLIGGGVWNRLPDEFGWETHAEGWVRVDLDVTIRPSVPATVFGLTYGGDGALLTARRLGPLADGATSLAFRPRPDGTRWNVGIHVPASTEAAPSEVEITRVRVVHSTR